MVRNPRLFCRVMSGKISAVRRLPPLPVSQDIDGVRFEYTLEDYRGTAAMYFGSYAPLVIDAMQRLLKPGDIFFDVGANIGYISAVAARLVGIEGQVHAFEPVPSYFARLQRLAQMNPARGIYPNDCALGENETTQLIYVTREPGQNTLVPSYKSAPEITRSQEVRATRLDSYIESRRIERVSLIKIDVEGYEFPVLKGFERYLRRKWQRPPVICEIAPRAYPLMKTSVGDLARYMDGFGYSAVDLADRSTPVDLTKIRHVEDVLFLPKAAA